MDDALTLMAELLASPVDESPSTHPPSTQPPTNLLEMLVAATHDPSRACAVWRPFAGRWTDAILCAACAYDSAKEGPFYWRLAPPQAGSVCRSCRRELT